MLAAVIVDRVWMVARISLFAVGLVILIGVGGGSEDGHFAQSGADLGENRFFLLNQTSLIFDFRCVYSNNSNNNNVA